MVSSRFHRAASTDTRRAALAALPVALLLTVGCPKGSGAAAGGVPGRPTPRRIVATQIPAGAAGEEVRRGLPRGSRIVVLDRSFSSVEPVDLTPDFAAAGRPEVSFDGEHILFVARRAPDDPMGIWEMRIDGSAVRQVAQPEGDCESAIYLSTIFTLDAERPRYQIGFAMRDPADGQLSLYTCLMDGSNVRRITFAPHGVSDPLLLSDGRLLFSMASGEASSTLFTVNTDGTDVFPFAGQHEPQARRFAPCETDDGEVVYVESAGDGGGSLAAVLRRRSLTTRRTIASAPDEAYLAPSALPNGRLLASYRPENGDAAGTFGLYELDPASGKRIAPVYDDPEWHEIDAVAVRPRTVPPGRSTVVNDTGKVGQLCGLDAYVSDARDGPELARGTIASLRVTAALEEEVVVGVAEVESDGSFFVEVPARTPLRLETLDGSGQVLRAMKSWFWVMPVERRGCIGCHEDREMAPPNRHVLALRKPPQAIKIEPWKPGSRP
jgi:hypothetical protein